MQLTSKKRIQLYRASFISLCCLLSACANVTEKNSQVVNGGWQLLLDESMSQWEVWMGIPHDSVEGLPADTITADNLNVHGKPKEAMGLNNDVKNVFSMIEQDGQQVLYITGEIYGGLTTKVEFEDYHLSLQVKWGDKKWAPRLNAKRDSGLLFHCKGDHGAFWKVWKACQELQIQEKDFGDYIPLAGPRGKIRTSTQDGELKYDPEGKFLKEVQGYSHAHSEPDFANGEWNTVELYAVGDNAIFVINGVVVMVIEQSTDKSGKPLTSGQVQLQSEGAELFYREVKIRNIARFPTEILSRAKL